MKKSRMIPAFLIVLVIFSGAMGCEATYHSGFAAQAMKPSDLAQVKYRMLKPGAMVLKLGVAKPVTALLSVARVAPLAKPFWNAAAELATLDDALRALPGAIRPELVENDNTDGELVMKRSAMRPW